MGIGVKRIFCLVMSVLMCIVLCIPTFAYDIAIHKSDNSLQNTISLSGFSYNKMTKQVSKDYQYQIKALVNVNDFEPQLSITDAPEGFQNELTDLTLDKIANNIYQTHISSQKYVTLDMTTGQPLIDLVNGDKVYAFGGNRLSKISEYMERTKREYVNPKVMTRSIRRSGSFNIKTVESKFIRFQAFWDTTKSNKLSLRVNSLGEDYGAGVLITGIRVKGYVPESYVIVGANPTGINTKPNFAATMSYLVSLGSPVTIYIPEFSSDTSISSLNQNHFELDLDVGVKWDDFIYESGSEANGMLMHLFMDHNGETPYPSGTVDFDVHIAGFGTDTRWLEF